MSSGYLLNADGLTIWNGARTVFTTHGRLVNFLPTPNNYAFSAAFPDAVKAQIGLWSWTSDWSPPGAPSQWGWVSVGQAMVGAAAQEWTNVIVLGDAPPGANLFFGKVRVTRTVNPSHPWNGQTLAAPAFAGKWSPISGSMLLEQGLGIARVLSIYIADGTDAAPGPVGKLVAYLDHSVSGRCGGFRSWGDGSPNAGDATGGANRWFGPGASGQPVWQSNVAPAAKASSGKTSSSPVFIPFTQHRWDGSDPPVYSDPTNYSSTYAVEVAGRFGRHAA